MVKVSVIMSTHNRPKLLFRALQSYVNQDYKNKELLIFANNTCKETMKVIESFAIFPDVKLFIDDTPGFKPSEIFNQLWEYSSGELICQLHDDDAFTPFSISKRVNEFTSNKLVDVVYGGVAEFDIDEILLRELPGQSVNASRCLKNEYINFTTMMWRKDIKKKFMFDSDFIYNLDTLFKIQCLMECQCVAIRDLVMKYTIHSGQETKRGRLNGEIANEEKLIQNKLKKLYAL